MCATQCARAWHDLTLHTVSTLWNVKIALRLTLTVNLTLPWWEANQLAGFVGGSFPPWVTKLFGVLDGFKRCAAGFEASNPVPLPRARPCSERAHLKPSRPHCMGCCGSQ